LDLRVFSVWSRRASVLLSEISEASSGYSQLVSCSPREILDQRRLAPTASCRLDVRSQFGASALWAGPLGGAVERCIEALGQPFLDLFVDPQEPPRVTLTGWQDLEFD
jgi:hypothetical protein